MSFEEDAEDISWSCWLRTGLVGSGAILLLVFIGMNEAQSSVLLPQLKEADSFIRVTPDEESWIASLGILMAPISSIIFGPFIDAFGRKKGLQLFYLITCLGYAVTASAQDVYHIYAGRIICGIGDGLLVGAIVYMVEICTEKQRDYFLASTSALYACGMVLMSVISGYLPWYTASLICGVAASILFIVQFFVPESPAWLFKTGKESAAVHSFQMLGRAESEIRHEINILKLQCMDNKEKLEWRTFLEPTVWKPFVIMVILFLVQNWTGVPAYYYYSVDFVKKLGTNHDPLDVAVMLSATRLLASCTICIFFQSRVGRKFAMAFSGFWMAVAFITLGAYEYVYHDVDGARKPFQWLPVIAMVIYVTASVLGLMGLPWVMSGEVYPLKVRGTMTGVTHLIAWGFMFVVVKTYNMSMEALQIYNLLFMYAGFSLVAGFYAIFVLPETQNKNLLEIEQSFLPKNRQLKTDAPQITEM